MKRIFTLLTLVCLASFTLIGQNAIKNRNTTTSLMGKHPEGKSMESFIPGIHQQRMAQEHTNRKAVPEFKSGQLVKQKLDFTVYEYVEDTAVGFVTSLKDEYLYNESGQNVAVLWHECDEETGVCPASYRTNLGYDEKGNLNLYLSLHLDEVTGEWIQSNKEDIFFDDSNRMTQILGYIWIDSSNLWKNNYKDEYTYDSNGNEQTYIAFRWIDSIAVWANSFKEEITWDLVAHTRVLTNFNWNQTTQAWVRTTKTDYSYDEKGNELLVVDYDWLDNTQEWRPDQKTESAYTAEGKIIRVVTYHVNMDTGAWITSYQDDYSYDELGNVNRVDEIAYDYLTGEQRDLWRTDFTFNNEYTLDDLVLPHNYFPIMFGNHMLVSITGSRLDTVSNTWITDMLMSYLYSEINLNSVPDIAVSKIRLYPNPASDFIRIETGNPFDSATFELVDTQGRKVLSVILNGNQVQIPVAQLKSGIYLYQILEKGTYTYGKILIR